MAHDALRLGINGGLRRHNLPAELFFSPALFSPPGIWQNKSGSQGASMELPNQTELASFG
jgi:hypothetical protein